MIFGIGTDIVEIDRVHRAAEKNPRFLHRLFTNEELAYFEERKMNSQHIAGGFCAKEAILKSLGTGLRGMSWQDIEVLRDDAGKPIVLLHGKAKEHAVRNNISSISISISHSQNYATAVAIAEQ